MMIKLKSRKSYTTCSVVAPAEWSDNVKLNRYIKPYSIMGANMVLCGFLLLERQSHDKL